jgi:hypothetical protein
MKRRDAKKESGYGLAEQRRTDEAAGRDVGPGDPGRAPPNPEHARQQQQGGTSTRLPYPP